MSTCSSTSFTQGQVVARDRQWVAAVNAEDIGGYAADEMIKAGGLAYSLEMTHLRTSFTNGIFGRAFRNKVFGATTEMTTLCVQHPRLVCVSLDKIADRGTATHFFGVVEHETFFVM